jgi:cellulose synthase/poly-beta-1,6-N-acetylglucosamine synthase-like glycosyltransferase
MRKRSFGRRDNAAQADNLFRWLAWPIGLALVAFNLRRLIFTLVALMPAPNLRRASSAIENPQSQIHNPKSVLILVPCRNEAGTLPGLIDCLARLNYSADRLSVALIDDGSTDATHALIDGASENHPGWHAVHFAGSRGKPQALNQALAQIGFGEIVVVYDADHRPDPDSLQTLTAAFDDPAVAGASGRTIPLNALASLPAYYATVESLVHQMITMRAKDRLDLAPALLGSNCAYRRSVLEEAVGFRPGALLEDSDLTLGLARLGYRLRFVPEAVARHQAPESVDGYVKQHLRWARGFNDVARDHASGALVDAQLPLRLRLELAMFSLGYLDRLALLAGVALNVIGRIRSSLARRRMTSGEWLANVLKIALGMPLAQIAAVFVRERAPREMWLRFPALPLLFGLDVLVAARAAIDSTLNRPRVWSPTQRIDRADFEPVDRRPQPEKLVPS